MLGQIFKLFKSARNVDLVQTTGQAHYQNNRPVDPQVVEWQPLDVTKLSITTNRVREIEAGMVKDARSEFAAVTDQLKSSQRARKTE